MRIVLTSWGSLGDLHPYLGIGSALARRGHDVTLATCAMYAEKVERAGLRFAPLRPDGPELGTMEDVTRRALHPVRGPEVIIREMLMPRLRDTHADLLAACSGPRRADVLVTHPIVFPGPLVAEQLALPWVSVALAPLSFFSAHDPPVMPAMPAFHALRVLGPRVYGALFRASCLAIRSWTRPVEGLRRELGLGPGRGRPLFEGQFSETMTLATFSPVMGRPQPDWPPNVRITGFPGHDEAAHVPLDHGLEGFLGEGEPPVVVALGSTGSVAGLDVHAALLDGVRRVGSRAVLVAAPQAVPPQAKGSPLVFHAEYAPFSSLFPRASVIVHHGGIGTLAQALRAGRPQLVTPFSHDQPDNAARVVRLGIARAIPSTRVTARRVEGALRSLRDDAGLASRVAAVAAQVRQEPSGVEAAADAIEEVGVGKVR